MKILEEIENHAKQQPHLVALSFDKQDLTYSELIKELNIKSGLFSNIPKHSFVGVVTRHPQKTMILYLALLKNECVPCIFDDRWSSAQTFNLVEKYGVQYLIEEDDLSIHNVVKKDKFKNDGDLLHIAFTSGTTGLPKAYYRGALSWIKSFSKNDQLFDRTINTIVAPGPMSHSLSLYACIYALYTGRTFIGQQYFEAKRLMQTIQHHKVNIACFMVPTMIQACVSTRILIEGKHYILSTGDKLALHVRQRIQQCFPESDLIEFFGTSEASFISYNFNNSAPPESVGKLFHNVHVNIEQSDESGIGLLKIRSDMSFSGYVDEDICKDRWIETGDFASCDAQGHLFLHGRKHDRMIIGGRNVYPFEIEQNAKYIDLFNEVVVISKKHSRFGEIAILLYTSDRIVSYNYFRTIMKHHVARYQIPSKLVKVKHMIYTSSGKIARERMKQCYLKGEL
ncbi:AMP-binding protein [Staphylococcus cohnii]|uniref:AMP-binding protein n=1 Tax=Staphylococcus TaxID=1279 RepID=UPI0012B2E7BC|nr:MULTISPECIES: AMP-binding protein [Staphylococcus]MCE5034610.1 AMP-binding protein [Staphylococcus cohnii]MCE5098485.1 AMP-binding protein [Staphylococcus cohnii]MSU30240.1 AMP-binding protein [Staphylococcus sp. McC-251-APC-3A2]